MRLAYVQLITLNRDLGFRLLSLLCCFYSWLPVMSVRAHIPNFCDHRSSTPKLFKPSVYKEPPIRRNKGGWELKQFVSDSGQIDGKAQNK